MACQKNFCWGNSCNQMGSKTPRSNHSGSINPRQQLGGLPNSGSWDGELGWEPYKEANLLAWDTACDEKL